jgi:phosphoglycolate phosphatase-like HAD superfamily hydrolase
LIKYLMENMTEKNLIFDLDDTLIDTSSAILRRIYELLDCYPVREGALYIYHLLAHSERESILATRYDFSYEFWRDYEKLRKKFRNRPIGGKGIKNKLEQLSAQGIRMGLLTRAPNRKVIEFIRDSGVQIEFFQLGIYDSDNLRYKKPHPLCFHPILQKCGSENTFYCGDSLEDLRLARKSKINFIAVCTGLTNRETFIQAGVKNGMIFGNIFEVEL